MATKNETKTEVKTEAKKETGEKMVKVFLPKVSRDQEDQLVGVNMKTYIVKRGVQVEVPESVAEVLQHSEEMRMQAMEYEADAQK